MPLALRVVVVAFNPDFFVRLWVGSSLGGGGLCVFSLLVLKGGAS